MAALKFRDKSLLEDYLQMEQGYVLNFSDRTFSDFFADFGVDIDSEPYLAGHSGSKANRMRAFWKHAPDSLVGEVLHELIDHAESYRTGPSSVSDCRAIAERLRSNQPAAVNRQPAQAQCAEHEELKRIAGRPIEVFFSYAHEDEELMDEVRRQLVVHERLGTIEKWHDRKIPAGDEWRSEIDQRIERALVILLFMSPHFLESRYCYEVEGQVALRRHKEGSARVIPVVLRACDWTASPFGEIQGLPRDGKPITQWPDIDQASLDVARGIMESIREFLGRDS